MVAAVRRRDPRRSRAPSRGHLRAGRASGSDRYTCELAGASSGLGRSPRDKTGAPPARDSERKRRRRLLVSRRRCTLVLVVVVVLGMVFAMLGRAVATRLDVHVAIVAFMPPTARKGRGHRCEHKEQPNRRLRRNHACSHLGFFSAFRESKSAIRSSTKRVGLRLRPANGVACGAP